MDEGSVGNREGKGDFSVSFFIYVCVCLFARLFELFASLS